MWTIDINEKQCTQWHDVYTLFYKGLVRAQVIGKYNARQICNALNAAAVDGTRIDS